MGATSVTGKGKGMALGPDGKPAKQKPENQCGCGLCGEESEEEEPKEPIKRGCVVTHRSGNLRGFKFGNSTGIKVC